MRSAGADVICGAEWPWTGARVVLLPARAAHRTRSLGKTHLDPVKEVQMAGATTRGVLFVHSAPRALCPHVEWAAGGVLDVRLSLDWIPQPAAPGLYRTELSWQAEQGTGRAAGVRPARLGPPALRGDRGAEPGRRRRPLEPQPRAGDLPRRDRRARQRRGPRGPGPARARESGTATRRPMRRRARPGAGPAPGTTSSSRSATPATAPRCAGCTGSADAGRPSRRPRSPARTSEGPRSGDRSGPRRRVGRAQCAVDAGPGRSARSWCRTRRKVTMIRPPPPRIIPAATMKAAVAPRRERLDLDESP